MRKSITVAVMVLLMGTMASGADFLANARGGGMGFSYFLLGDDPSGALFNPSALGYVYGWQAQLMYENVSDYDYRIVSEKPYYGHFGFTYYKPEAGTFALNSLQSGSFSELTNIPTQNHLAVSYGRKLAPNWATGATVKFVKENGFGKRSAFDFDLGFSFRSPQGFAAAAAFENIIRSALTPEYLGVKEYLPRRGRLGAGYFLTRANFQGAFLAAGQFQEYQVTEKLATSLVNLGTEWWFYQTSPMSFGARTGYTFGQAVRDNLKSDYSGPTAGISLNFKVGFNNLRLDYAWQMYPFKADNGTAPGSHFVAFTFGWGGVPSYPSHAQGSPLVAEKSKPSPKQQVAQVTKPAPKQSEQMQQPIPQKVEVPKQPPPNQIAQVTKPAPKQGDQVQQIVPQKVEAPKQPPPNQVAQVTNPSSKQAEQVKQQTPQKAEKAKEPPPNQVAQVTKPLPQQAQPIPPPAQIFKEPAKDEAELPLKDKDTDFGKIEFLKYNVAMEVNAISSLDFKRIIFYARAQQLVKTVTWRLYIFKAKIKSWTEEEANRWALATIEGRGVPPGNIVWNGIGSDGQYVPAGKYYYILTAVDAKGQNYATEWFSFKLE